MSLLISHGHREKDIPDYSVEAFRLYLSAALKVERRNRSSFVVDTANAVSVLFAKKGKNPLEEYVAKLLEED